MACKPKRDMSIAIMTTVRALHTMDACVAQRDADGAVRAYSEIVELNQRCRPDAMTPRDHVVWLYNLNHGWLHILERECLALSRVATHTLAGAEQTILSRDVRSAQFVVARRSPRSSRSCRGRVPALGAGAVAVVHLKQAVLWWERGM